MRLSTLTYRQTTLTLSLVLIALSVISYLILRSAAAQNTRPQTGVSVSPALIERDVAPGDILPLKLKVANLERNQLTFYFLTSDFTGDPNNGGKPQFLDNPAPGSFSSWVKLSDAKIVVNPGQTAEYDFTIEVPSDAEPGSHYGAILVALEDPKKAGASQVAATSQVGTLLFTKVAGEVFEKGRVISFKTDQSTYQYPPVKFQISFENQGNVITKPTGIIEVFNSAGVKEEVLQINTGFGNVLPKSTRTFEESWNPKKWLNIIPRIGRYTATAVVTYGLPTTTQRLTPVSFWIIPWPFLLTVGGSILGFFILLAIMLKIYTNFVIRHHSKSRGR